MQPNSTNRDFYYSLLHISEALNNSAHDRLQMLSRVLISRLEEYRSVYRKLESLHRNIQMTEKSQKFCSTSADLISHSQNKSSMRKKKVFLLKLVRGLELQICDTVVIIDDVLSSLTESKVKSIVKEKIRAIERMRS